MKSGDDEVTSLMESVQEPLLLNVSSSSTKEPTQQCPKLPWSAITVSSAPVPPKPVAMTSSFGVTGSSLIIWIVALSATPRVVGLYSIVKSTWEPGAIESGVAGAANTAKSLDPEIRWILLINRLRVPTLKICRVRYFGPRQTTPKWRSSCKLTAIAGP